ncbi:MAG TPA: biotin/lipoyl-binding protein, partial [Thermoanaerobaculia bacterium]|nr:biotin/lipoyl-binding protein [Thermoanaerobaculia bacterium]
MKRIIVPAIGLALVTVTVMQVKAPRDAQAAPRVRGAAPERAPLAAEGRVVACPGAEVTVGTDVAGTIERIGVVEKDTVRKGDVIAVIRADDTRAAVAEAEARVAEAGADIRLFEAERDRARALWQEDVGPKQAWEKAERDLAA